MYIFMFYSLFINKNVHVFFCFYYPFKQSLKLSLLLCFDYIFMNKNVRNTKNTKKPLYHVFSVFSVFSLEKTNK